MTATNIQQANLHMAAQSSAAVMERVIIAGDLGALSPADRVTYYMRVCESVGLNPLTKPSEYIKLNGKLTLYALKTTTDQLRQIHGVSIYQVDTTTEDGVCVCAAHARTAGGREDMDIGAVNLKGLQGENLANARMKALTKAKRRVTLSICGLGWLDESEVDSVPSAERVKVDMETGEVTPPPSKELQGEIRRMWGEATPHIDQQAYAAKYPNWRTDAAQAAALREDLKAVLGNRGTAAPQAEQVKSDPPAEDAAPWQEPAAEAASAPETVPAIPMATKEQIGQLQAAAKGMGADSSEKRAALWGYLLMHDAPCSTKSLSEEEAMWLLNRLSQPDATPENRAKWFAATLQKFPAATEDE